MFLLFLYDKINLYKYLIFAAPDELCINIPKFSTRHTASGVLTHVDGSSVGAFGYLPQDIIGRSIMEFYHPEDFPYLKTVYESVMKSGQTPGVSFSSKPYRFLIQNNSYITIETEWSSFVNPWSRKLEFINGIHKVIQGPKNIDVFSAAFKEPLTEVAEECHQHAKMIQEEIFKLLDDPVPRSSETVKQQVSKRCQALANFMESLMTEINKSDLKIDLPHETDITVSERDSVMLGEISPHHDYYDSKSSSETPPSYNQLNYNENLQRFFSSQSYLPDSQVDTMTIEQSENDSGGASNEQCKTNPRDSLSPQNCVESRSESGGNLSSTSNAQMDCGGLPAENQAIGRIVKPMTLTEALLSKHNDDMEKVMLKKYREARVGYRNDKNRMKNDRYYCDMTGTAQVLGQGIKRSGSTSWENEAHKSSKHQHVTENHKEMEKAIAKDTEESNRNNNTVPLSTASKVPITPITQAPRNVELWPPFSVSLTSMQNTTVVTPSSLTAPTVYPTVYYIPTSQALPSQEHPGPSPSNGSYGIQYMARIVYPQPSLFGQPFVYPQPQIIYQPLPFNQPVSSTAGSGIINQQNSQAGFAVRLPDQNQLLLRVSFTILVLITFFLFFSYNSIYLEISNNAFIANFRSTHYNSSDLSKWFWFFFTC